MVYAAKTTVDVDKTRYEIERTLKRYGADQFSYGCDDSRGIAVIQFRAQNRHIRFVLVLPKITDKEYQRDKRGKIRTPIQKQDAVTQATRSRWRALLICVKAKLEAVESKIESFEEAFMAHVVLPDGKTASEWLSPQIAIAYESGKMPQSLLALPAPDAPQADGGES
jgi:hypothetical protein